MTELVWDGKYDKEGRRVAPLRVGLPFQTVETVNESAQERQRSLDLFSKGHERGWRNRLIWGDKKYVLPALVAELAGKVDLVYIDPPFATGDDFSFTARVPAEEDDPEGSGASFMREPTLIEQKAYRDTWGVSAEERRSGVTSLDKYIKWFYETIVFLHELLAETGSLFVHLDSHVSHYAKGVLDEVFGSDNFRNEIVWYYYNKFQGNVNRFASNHDVIFWYSKSPKYKFERLREKRLEGAVRQIKRTWNKDKGRIVNVKGSDGKVVYQETDEKTVDDVWRISMLQPADRTENVFFPTQKPVAVVERVIRSW